MRMRGISMNWRERRGLLPSEARIEAESTTYDDKLWKRDGEGVNF